MQKWWRKYCKNLAQNFFVLFKVCLVSLSLSTTTLFLPFSISLSLTHSLSHSSTLFLYTYIYIFHSISFLSPLLSLSVFLNLYFFLIFFIFGCNMLIVDYLLRFLEMFFLYFILDALVCKLQHACLLVFEKFKSLSHWIILKLLKMVTTATKDLRSTSQNIRKHVIWPSVVIKSTYQNWIGESLVNYYRVAIINQLNPN